MAAIPDSHDDLFDRETFCHFVTLLPNGYPHVAPVWVDRDGDEVLVNSARGRRKVRNVRNDQRVGFSMLDPDDPYRFLSGWGDVIEVTTEGAAEHIDELARRYVDVDRYPNRGPDKPDRVILRIRPENVVTG